MFITKHRKDKNLTCNAKSQSRLPGEEGSAAQRVNQDREGKDLPASLEKFPVRRPEVGGCDV